MPWWAGVILTVAIYIALCYAVVHVVEWVYDKIERGE